MKYEKLISPKSIAYFWFSHLVSFKKKLSSNKNQKIAFCCFEKIKKSLLLNEPFYLSGSLYIFFNYLQEIKNKCWPKIDIMLGGDLA